MRVWEIRHKFEPEVVELLKLIVQNGGKIMATLDDIITKVEAVKGVDLSLKEAVTGVATAIKDLRDQLAAAGTDPAKLQQVADSMDQLSTDLTQQKDDLVAAVQAPGGGTPTP